MTCGYLPVRQVDILGERSDGYLAECGLKKGHGGPHIFKTPEGKFFAWEDDMDCGCCAPEEEDRCYAHWEISEAEARKMAEAD